MPTRIVVGIDGSGAGGPAVDFARGLARQIGDCEIILAHVIEWSPFTFQTPEENEERHKRREEEIETAMVRGVAPAVAQLEKEGFNVRGIVRHGNVADVLDRIAQEEEASQIVVARTAAHGLSERIFGSSTANLVMHASVPVTVVT